VKDDTATTDMYCRSPSGPAISKATGNLSK